MTSTDHTDPSDPMIDHRLRMAAAQWRETPRPQPAMPHVTETSAAHQPRRLRRVAPMLSSAAAVAVIAAGSATWLTHHNSHTQTAAAGSPTAASSPAANPSSAEIALLNRPDWVLKTQTVDGGEPTKPNGMQTFRLGPPHTQQFLYTNPACALFTAGAAVHGSTLDITTYPDNVSGDRCNRDAGSVGIGVLDAGSWTWSATPDQLRLTKAGTTLTYDHGDPASTLSNTLLTFVSNGNKTAGGTGPIANTFELRGTTGFDYLVNTEQRTDVCQHISGTTTIDGTRLTISNHTDTTARCKGTWSPVEEAQSVLTNGQSTIITRHGILQILRDDVWFTFGSNR